MRLVTNQISGVLPACVAAHLTLLHGAFVISTGYIILAEFYVNQCKSQTQHESFKIVGTKAATVRHT